MQEDAETLEGAPDSEAAIALSGKRQAAYDKLLRLEDEVHLQRNLLEEEEQVMYVDGVNELMTVFEHMEDVRAAQGFKLTPWVCPALFFAPGGCCTEDAQGFKLTPWVRPA